MSFAIIIDSVSDISRDYAKKHEIQIVPMSVTFYGKEYYEDEAFDLKKFYSHFNEDGFLPKTSQPSPASFYEAYKNAIAEGKKEILVITVSSGLSGTFNSASIAARMIKEETEGIEIEVVDSLNCSHGEVYLAETAVLMRNEEKPFAEVVVEVRSKITKLTNHVFLLSLKFLRAAGRVNIAKYWIAKILKKKPIIKMDEKGENVVVASETSVEKGLLKMLEMTTKDFTIKPLKIALVHANSEEMAQILEDQILEHFEEVNIRTILTGVTVSSNTGPNSIALICEFAEEQ
ncbi:MAG: DegV family protein [Candidatus Kariarchaeaceae archaeon]